MIAAGLVTLPVIATTAPVKPLAFIAEAGTEVIAPAAALISVAVGVTGAKVRVLVVEAPVAVEAYQTPRVLIGPLIAHP